MSSTEVTDVLIIGAGSTGLLLAQGLKAAGISFRIFERHSKDAVSREWSMSLHWGGEFLSKVLPPDLQARQGEIDTDPHYDNSKDDGFLLCNGATAEVILNMAGIMPRRVSRRKLKALLAENINIEYGMKLENVEKNRSNDLIMASFHDGSSVTARLIVGCDGSRSRIREFMIQNKKLSENTETPYTVFNFPQSFPADVSKSIRDVHPIIKIAHHPTQNIMYLLAMLDGAPEDPAEWKHQILISWAGPPTAVDLPTQESRRQRLIELAPQWAHPWSTAITNVPEDTEIFVDSMSQWDPRPVYRTEEGNSIWSETRWYGLLTLAGDSMHTMLPHRGQGLNNALEDAARLVTALTSVFKDKSKSLEAAIAEYETEAVARGGLEVEVTARQAKATHDYQTLLQSPMFKHGANKVR